MPSPDLLSLRALNRALLSRQLLLRPEPMPEDGAHNGTARAGRVIETVEHLVGLQAQAPFPPYYGLWSRLAGFRPDDLAGLLLSRQVVRIALMRGTIHLVSARDCLLLRPLVQPALDRGLGTLLSRQLAGVDTAELAAVGRVLVEERPLTFSELGAALSAQWPQHPPAALAQGVRALVPLVRLVTRYLAAFGPASIRDAQAWSGLTRLREVADRLRPGLRVFRDEQGTELFDLPDAPRPDPGTPAPVRLVAEFDNIALSHADRARIISEPNRQRMFTRNGIFPGTVLVDGFGAGMWKISLSRAAAALTIELFRPLGPRDRDAVTDEGRRLLAFAAPDSEAHDIRFAPLA